MTTEEKLTADKIADEWDNGVNDGFFGTGAIFDKMYNHARILEKETAKLRELVNVSSKVIGEIIDNYEADAINLPAEMYNELKFHWKQLKKQL